MDKDDDYGKDVPSGYMIVRVKNMFLARSYTLYVDVKKER